MKKSILILLLGVSATLSAATNNVIITKDSNITNLSIAKVYCNLLKKGQIKQIARHFTGKRLEHIQQQNMSSINNIAEGISNRYQEADCSFITLKEKGNSINGYPFGTAWYFEFSVDTDNNSWKALNY